MIKHQTQPRKVMLNSKKEVTIDPRYWNADMNVTINTGIGTGSRERDMAMLGRTLQNQLLLAERLMMAGDAEDAIDMLPKIVTTMTKMDESAGIQNAEDFYPEFTKERIAQLKQVAAQPKPDPAVALEEAKGKVTMQVEQGKNHLAMQKMNVDAQASQREAELKAQGEIAKNTAELQADLQTKQADRENAIIIAQQQGQIDLEKQNRQIAFEMWKVEQANQLERERMANAQTIAAMKPKPEPKAQPAN
jgi:hypothetical protein